MLAIYSVIEFYFLYFVYLLYWHSIDNAFFSFWGVAMMLVQLQIFSPHENHIEWINIKWYKNKSWLIFHIDYIFQNYQFFQVLVY